MILNMNFYLYKSHLTVRYVNHLSAYVVDMVARSATIIATDITQMQREHADYELRATLPIKTARGYEATVLFNAKTTTIGVSNA